MINESKNGRGGRRPRTTGFPVIPLDEAAALSRTVGMAEGKTFTKSALAGHLGLQTTNSGVFAQKLAALRAWGLVHTVEGETLELTNVGRTIALEADPTARSVALRQAFLDCDVFARVYDATAKGRAVDVGDLASRAVLDVGVSPQKKNEFVRSLVASAVAAELAHELDSGRVQFMVATSGVPTALIEGEIADKVPGSTGRGDDQRAARLTRGEPRTRPVVRQTWPFDGGEVVVEVHSDYPLPADVFTKVGLVFARVEELVAALGTPRAG